MGILVCWLTVRLQDILADEVMSALGEAEIVNKTLKLPAVPMDEAEVDNPRASNIMDDGRSTRYAVLGRSGVDLDSMGKSLEATINEVVGYCEQVQKSSNQDIQTLRQQVGRLHHSHKCCDPHL